jgi:hypothetical protein
VESDTCVGKLTSQVQPLTANTVLHPSPLRWFWGQLSTSSNFTHTILRKDIYNPTTNRSNSLRTKYFPPILRTAVTDLQNLLIPSIKTLSVRQLSPVKLTKKAGNLSAAEISGGKQVYILYRRCTLYSNVQLNLPAGSTSSNYNIITTFFYPYIISHENDGRGSESEYVLNILQTDLA